MKKTVEKFTKGKFKYAIATHIDRTCIHNDIIFNSFYTVDYKWFNPEPYKQYQNFIGLAIQYVKKMTNNIKITKNDSKSYYE